MSGVTIEVQSPGMLTTVQDLGRPGWQTMGVTPGGAVDRQALRVGNLLLANAPEAAALECTLVGPRLRFSAATYVCLAGAEAEKLPMWRPFRVEAGDELEIGPLRLGARLMVCVAGGIDVPAVLGSRSTHLQAGFGGVEGRALRRGDVLPVGPSQLQPLGSGGWTVSRELVPVYETNPRVRVLPGPQWRAFTAAARDRFFATEFAVSPQSDRMGLRLEGAPILRQENEELVSEPVTTGTVQVPPDGSPIVLLADRQTLGGYPKLATVIAVDLPLVAQLRPGDHLRFVRVGRRDAERLFAANERSLALLRAGMKSRRAPA